MIKFDETATPPKVAAFTAKPRTTQVLRPR